MPRNPVTNRSCDNAECTLHGQFGKGNIIRHGFFRRKRGRRRRYCNFVGPHRGLKFGKETRTPAMQAGLASRRLSFRQIFMAMLLFVLFCLDLPSEEVRISRARLAA